MYKIEHCVVRADTSSLKWRKLMTGWLYLCVYIHFHHSCTSYAPSSSYLFVYPPAPGSCSRTYTFSQIDICMKVERRKIPLRSHYSPDKQHIRQTHTHIILVSRKQYMSKTDVYHHQFCKFSYSWWGKFDGNVYEALNTRSIGKN